MKELEQIERFYVIGIGNNMHLGTMRKKDDVVNDILFMLNTYIDENIGKKEAEETYYKCLNTAKLEQFNPNNVFNTNNIPF